MNENMSFTMSQFNSSKGVPLAPLSVVEIGMCAYVMVITAITLTYNFLIVLVFIRDKRVRTPFNYYLLNLTIADACLGLFGISFLVANVLNRTTPFGFEFCGFTVWAGLTSSSAAAYAVLMISLDRFWSVFWPIQYRNQRSVKLTFMACGGMWLFVNAFTIPVVVIERLYYPSPPGTCMSNVRGDVSVGVMWEVCLFVFPLCAVAVSYMFVIWKVGKRARSAKVEPVDGMSKEKSVFERNERKLFLTLTGLTIMMIVLWSPASIFYLLDALIDGIFDPVVFATVLCVEYTSCAINPFVYHQALPDISRALKELFFCRKETKSGNSKTVSKMQTS